MTLASPFGGAVAAAGLGYGGLGQLVLYLSLLACLWVVVVAIGLALLRKNKRDYLLDVYKPVD